jgi:hypothetical protein
MHNLKLSSSLSVRKIKLKAAQIKEVKNEFRETLFEYYSYSKEKNKRNRYNI